MSLIVRTFGCDKCGHEWDVCDERDAPAPKRCPKCSVHKRKRESRPRTTAVGRRLASKSHDSVYRALEKGSKHRADIAGNPALAITDLKSNVRPGDVVAKKVVNEVTKYAEANGGFWSGGVGARGPTTQAMIAQAKSSSGAWAVDAVRTRVPGASMPQLSPAQVANLRKIARSRQ